MNKFNDIPVGTTKQCARCSKPFTCCNNAVSAGACPCTTIRLSHSTLLYLKQTYNDCLCLDCLYSIKEEQEATTH